MKLQAQVQELQKQLDKQSLISSETSSKIQTEASKDEIMQNIHVLIKGTERQSEKAEETVKRLLKSQQAYKQSIEML